VLVPVRQDRFPLNFSTLQVPRHEGVWGPENIAAYTILALDRGKSLLHTPTALPPGKETAYHLDRRLAGSQRQPRHSVKLKIFRPVGNERSVVI